MGLLTLTIHFLCPEEYFLSSHPDRDRLRRWIKLENSVIQTSTRAHSSIMSTVVKVIGRSERSMVSILTADLLEMSTAPIHIEFNASNINLIVCLSPA